MTTTAPGVDTDKHAQRYTCHHGTMMTDPAGEYVGVTDYQILRSALTAAGERIAFMQETSDKAEAVIRRQRERINALERIETLAKIWSAYQDDDSKKDQATDPGLRIQAANAETELYEAVS